MKIDILQVGRVSPLRAGHGLQPVAPNLTTCLSTYHHWNVALNLPLFAVGILAILNLVSRGSEIELRRRLL